MDVAELFGLGSQSTFAASRAYDWRQPNPDIQLRALPSPSSARIQQLSFEASVYPMSIFSSELGVINPERHSCPIHLGSF